MTVSAAEREQLGLWLVAAVMLSPTAWFHYLLLMLIPFAQIASAVNRRQVSIRAVCMAPAGYVLTGLIRLTGLMVNALAAAPSESVLFSMLRELQFVCLLMVAGATYRFAADGAEESGGVSSSEAYLS